MTVTRRHFDIEIFFLQKIQRVKGTKTTNALWGDTFNCLENDNQKVIIDRCIFLKCHLRQTHYTHSLSFCLYYDSTNHSVLV